VNSPSGLSALRAFERARLPPRERSPESVHRDLMTLHNLALACFSAASAAELRRDGYKAFKRECLRLRGLLAEAARILRSRGAHLRMAFAQAMHQARIGDRGDEVREPEQMLGELFEALAARLADTWPDALTLGNMSVALVEDASAVWSLGSMIYTTKGRTRKAPAPEIVLGSCLVRLLEGWCCRPRYPLAANFIRAALGVEIGARTLKERISEMEKNVRLGCVTIWM
jgi:hypothetical protein